MPWFQSKASSARVRKPSRPSKVPQDADTWRLEAEAAEDSGEWARAVVCYRRALSLAPFCTDLRQSFEFAIEDQILADESIQLANGKAGAKMRPRFFDDEEVEATPAVDPSDAVLESLVGELRAKRRLEADEDEDEPATRKTGGPLKRRPAGRRRHQPFPWKTVRIAASLLLAAGLTIAALVGVSAATGYVRNLFGNDALPALSESEALPEGLKSAMGEANSLILAGKPEQAVKELDALRDKFPASDEFIVPALAQAYRALGNAEMRGGRYDQAAEAFRGATEADPQSPLNWIDLGRALRDYSTSSSLRNQTAKQRDVLTEAEKAFARALALSPNDSSALLGLAQVYNARNNRQGAVETYEKLVAIAPDSSEGRMAERALKQLRPR